MKKHKRENVYNIDTSKKYLIGMIPNDKIRYEKNAELVEADIVFDDGTIIVTKEGYQTMYIHDIYFDWMLNYEHNINIVNN